MSRLPMPSAMPAELAERDSDVERAYTAAEQMSIERLADSKMQARLYGDLSQFDDLLAGIDGEVYERPLQSALARLDAACEGDTAAMNAITQALTEIQRTLKRVAERLWLDDLREEAETELFGVEER